MKTKDLFVVRPTNEENNDFIVTIGRNLATEKRFKTKEEAKNYIKYPKWDTTFALIAEMIELNNDAKCAKEEKPKEPTNKKAK